MSTELSSQKIMTPAERNGLRCIACEIARKLWVAQDYEQLEILKHYVDRCFEEVQKIRERERTK